jgi:23S rRNA pseudouridine2605 synthase
MKSKPDNKSGKKKQQTTERSYGKPSPKKHAFPERTPRKNSSHRDESDAYRSKERKAYPPANPKSGYSKRPVTASDDNRRSRDKNFEDKEPRKYRDNYSSESTYKNSKTSPDDSRRTRDKKFDATEPRNKRKNYSSESPYKKNKTFSDDNRRSRDNKTDSKDSRNYRENYTSETPYRKNKTSKEAIAIDSPMTLNKYIAHSGACSRREAAELVKLGKVRVNGSLVLEPGYRVMPGDHITLSGKIMTPQKDLVYILLNKPKGVITTSDDPEGRKTVFDLVPQSETGRLFSVGRLDRNTTGLLLLTNDGKLAHKLSHPSYLVKKIYHVTLNKKLTVSDYQKIVKGLTLEDGPVEVDEIAYLANRNEIGLEIHSGRNRIVRRIFESLGYEVEKLDRVMYAGLTKKNLPRGKWRYLSEQEIVLLRHFKS